MIRTSWIRGALVAAVMLMRIVSVSQIHAQGSRMGAPIGAPIRLVLPMLVGDSVRIGGGAPPTVLAVFATWCRGCKEEVATLNALKREYASRGVQVIALSEDEGSSDRLSQWLEHYGATYGVSHDPSGAVARKIGVVGVPEVYFVNTNGVIEWSARGPLESRLATLKAMLEKVASKR